MTLIFVYFYIIFQIRFKNIKLDNECPAFTIFTLIYSNSLP